MNSDNCNAAQPEELTYDLLVAGGGMAGLCAAVAAARQGVKVALVQDRPVLGGNCSSEVRVVPHGTAHSNAWGAETGLPLEILLEDRAHNHEQFFDHGMINSTFDMLLLEKARRESNLILYLNTSIRGVESEPLEDPREPTATSNGMGRLGGERREIRSVYASQLGSEREFRFKAAQYLDATGDGTVGYLAGADFRYGREARHEFGENLAPIQADDVTLGSTITMRARDTGRPVAFTAPAWAEEYRTMDAIGNGRTLYHITKPVYGGYWWLEICNPFHQIRDNAEIRHELHRHVLGVWNFIKNHSDFRESAGNYALDWIGMVPGKRESRRLMGDVVLCEKDCHEDTSWPDAITYAGWWIDLHIKGGVLNKIDPGERENADRNYKHWIRISPYRLPLRSFYSRNVENLWMAGRCFSTTHVALGPARCMQTLGMTAHAVGIAAAWAIQHGITPRETANPKGSHIAQVQQLLLKDDVRVPGLRNCDPLDLAHSARVTASSEALLEPDRIKENWFHLGADTKGESRESVGLALVIPITENRIETLEFYLRNQTDADKVAKVELHPLKRIWDRPDVKPLAIAQVQVPADFEGWCRAEIHVEVPAGGPLRVALVECDGIAWAGAQAQPGVVLQYLHVSNGGCDEGNRHLPGFHPDEVELPAYRHWRQIREGLALRIDPPQKPYGAEAVNDGCAWVEDMPHLWMSDPEQSLPQHVQLDFGRSVCLSRVHISFDTNLSRLTQQEEAFFHPPECARDWRLLVLCDTEWKEVYREVNNEQRLRCVVFSAVETTAMRLEVLATHGLQEARVFEIRAYGR